MKECNYNTADPVADKISIPTNITNVHDNNSNHSKKWNSLKSVGLGQLLSVLICGTAICSGYLQIVHVNMPTGQSLFTYILLACCYLPYVAVTTTSGQQQHSLREALTKRGWKYLLLAVIDVEANYLIVKAYHYTTVTSVQLLDCLTIPNVMLLSRLVFRVKYQFLHYVGIFFSLIGIGTLTLSDYLVAEDSTEANSKIFGDVLVLMATVLYALSNVGQEYAMQKVTRHEYLGFIGLFGSAISAVQLILLEREEFLSTDFMDSAVYIPMVLFVVCLFAFYSLMPICIKLSGATSVNLNLLSADFYALVVGIFLFKYTFHYLYFVGFVSIIVGVSIYHLREPKYNEEREPITGAGVETADGCTVAP